MDTDTKQVIYFVDDEQPTRVLISRMLKRTGRNITCFERAVKCLEKVRPANCDLLITDIKMPEMDGLELINRVKLIAPLMPILVITGYGDIPLAVKVIKSGVLDILEKPFGEQDLISKVDAALERSRKIKSMLSEKLTRTETEVLKLILHGKSNKEAAKLLNRSVRTVEDHRAHIMRKMNVENAVDLAIKAVPLGLVEDEVASTPQ